MSHHLSTLTTRTKTHTQRSIVPFPPPYTRELTEPELRAWHKLRRIKPTGQFTQLIHDVAASGTLEKFRQLLAMLHDQIIDGNSDHLHEILAPGTVDAVEACLSIGG